MYDLQEQIEKANKEHTLDCWENVYVQAFPNITKIKNVRDKPKYSRNSITRRIKLESGRWLNVSEKIRFVDYGDILLEYISVDTTNAPGWVCKPTDIDYVAYAIKPSGVCHLIPMQELQAVWRRYSTEWFKYYDIKVAPNPQYNTLNLPIPTKVLKSALNTIQTLPFQRSTLT